MSTKPRIIKLEYIESGTFQGSEEKAFLAGFKMNKEYKLIEKSAYDEVVEALKFYADENNWQDSGFDYGHGTIDRSDRRFTRNESDAPKIGGAKAREVLEKHGVKI